MGAQPEWLMEAAEVWGARWDACDNPMVRRYMEGVCRKQSLVILAADLRTMAGLNELVDQVGPHIAALKTHVDLVEDWSVESWANFCEKAKDADILVHEVYSQAGWENKTDDWKIYHKAHHTSAVDLGYFCLLYTSPSPRDLSTSRMPSSA